MDISFRFSGKILKSMITDLHSKNMFSCVRNCGKTSPQEAAPSASRSEVGGGSPWSLASGVVRVPDLAIPTGFSVYGFRIIYIAEWHDEILCTTYAVFPA